MALLKDNGFRFCPGCGSRELHFGQKNLCCKSCAFVYYQNTAVGVGLVLSRVQRGETEVLLTVRAQAPKRGYHDLPGGFVDPAESLEQALKRELAEELGPELTEHRNKNKNKNKGGRKRKKKKKEGKKR